MRDSTLVEPRISSYELRASSYEISVLARSSKLVASNSGCSELKQLLSFIFLTGFQDESPPLLKIFRYKIPGRDSSRTEETRVIHGFTSFATSHALTVKSCDAKYSRRRLVVESDSVRPELAATSLEPRAMSSAYLLAARSSGLVAQNL